MERDVEILCEIIADNFNLLKKDGDFDEGIYEDVCHNLGFDLKGYLKDCRTQPGRFRNEEDYGG